MLERAIKRAWQKTGRPLADARDLELELKWACRRWLQTSLAPADLTRDIERVGEEPSVGAVSLLLAANHQPFVIWI